MNKIIKRLTNAYSYEKRYLEMSYKSDVKETVREVGESFKKLALNIFVIGLSVLKLLYFIILKWFILILLFITVPFDNQWDEKWKIA